MRRTVAEAIRTLADRLFILAAAAISFLAFSANESQAQTNPTLSFSWDAASDTDLAGYRLYWRIPAGSYNTTNRIGIANPAALTYTLSTLAEGTYYFQVTAYDAAGNESTPSNEVSYYVVKPSLEVGPTVGRAFSVQILNSSSTLIDSTFVAASTGNLRIPSNTPLPSTITLQIKAPGYLRKKFLGRSINDTTQLAALTAGDLDNNNIINGPDVNIINADYFQSGRASDLDNNGITNSIDFGYVINHYFATGE
jgi:hypothetical protein